VRSASPSSDGRLSGGGRRGAALAAVSIDGALQKIACNQTELTQSKGHEWDVRKDVARVTCWNREIAARVAGRLQHSFRQGRQTLDRTNAETPSRFTGPCSKEVRNHT